MMERLKRWAAERGYRIVWGPGSIVERVRREIEVRRSGSEIEGRFFDHELKSIVGSASSAEGQSVLIVAMPRPAHVVHFDANGQDFEALLPPTYFRYRATFEDVRMDLLAHGLPGARLEYLTAPLKAIAARLGLVRYGRNNISYAEGLGSYIQLCGYLVDVFLPQPEEEKSISMLRQCENCGMCVAACPTEAISEDRVLLRAERCLTYLNENEGAWPSWMSSRAHNCLLGCLECQRACPVNPQLRIDDTGLSFSSFETRWLLSRDAAADSRAETGIQIKLAWLGQPYVESILGRNLRALLNAGDRSGYANRP
jgi:epoxyqueuosine reductase